MMRFAGALMLTAAATGSVQIDAHAQAQTQPAVPAEAMRFARLYIPDAEVRAQARAAFRREAERMMTTDPQGAAMEKRYPGVRVAALAAGEQAIDRAYAERLPAMQERLARLVSANFTAAETGRLATFLASDAGQAMQRGVANNLDTTGLAERARRGELSVDAAQLEGTIDVAAAIGTLSPEQIAAIAEFGASPLGRKFTGFKDRLLGQVADDTTRLVEESGPKVQEAMMMAVREHARAAK